MTTEPAPREKLEKKLAAYQYLFKHGNEDPTEKQVELWMEYEEDGKLMYLGSKMTTEEIRLWSHFNTKEIAKVKLKFLRDVGLWARAGNLESHLNQISKKAKQEKGIIKPQVPGETEDFATHIKRVQAIIQGYNPESLKKSGGFALLMALYNKFRTDNPFTDEYLATRYKKDNSQGILHLGKNYEDLLFYIENLTQLGLYPNVFGLEITPKSQKAALKKLKQRKKQREKNKQTFDIVSAPVEVKSAKYIVILHGEEVQHKEVIVGSKTCYTGYRDYEGDSYYSRDLIPLRISREQVLGGGWVTIKDRDFHTWGTSGDFGYADANYILRQYFPKQEETT